MPLLTCSRSLWLGSSRCNNWTYNFIEVPDIILGDVWVSNSSELWFLDWHGQNTAREDLCYQTLPILEHALLNALDPCVNSFVVFCQDSFPLPSVP